MASTKQITIESHENSGSLIIEWHYHWSLLAIVCATEIQYLTIIMSRVRGNFVIVALVCCLHKQLISAFLSLRYLLIRCYTYYTAAVSAVSNSINLPIIDSRLVSRNCQCDHQEKQRQLLYWRRRLHLFRHMKYEFEFLRKYLVTHRLGLSLDFFTDPEAWFESSCASV